MVAVLAGAVAILDFQRYGIAFETPHPLRPAVGNRFGAFDRVDEVLAKAFLDDLLFFGRRGRSRRHGAAHRSAIHRSRGHLAAQAADALFAKLLYFVHRHVGQLGDFLDEVDRADDEPDLGVFVFFAAVVGDADETIDVERAFVLVGDRDVIGTPSDAAGEVRDLDRRLAVELALHVPVEHLRLVVREGGVFDDQLVGRREEL